MRVSKKTYPSQFDAIVESLTPRRLTTWIGLILIVGAATIGLMEISGTILDKVKTYDWVKVEGKIAKVENLLGNGRSKIYYIYSYEGNKYIGNNIDASRHNSITLNDRERQKLKNIIKENQSIPVFVNPDDPRKSYYNMRWYHFYVTIPVSLVFLLFIFLYIYVAISVLLGNISDLMKGR